jgi:hypothetical protein
MFDWKPCDLGKPLATFILMLKIGNVPIKNIHNQSLECQKKVEKTKILQDPTLKKC